MWTKIEKITKPDVYFDHNFPSYSLQPYKDILPFLKKRKAKLLDVGCAEGAGITFLSRKKKYESYGIEGSVSYKKKTLVDGRVFYQSILDTAKCQKLRNKFDYVLILRVLHHLVGDNIKESVDLEKKAIENALLMLKEGGEAIIYEPSFHPLIFNQAVFYIKRLASLVTNRRLPIGSYWLNIGPPIVNYFSIGSARSFFCNYQVKDFMVISNQSTLFNKIFKRCDLIIVVKKK